MKNIIRFGALGVFLLLSGCSSGGIPNVDVSQATCDTIEQYRAMVGQEYAAKLQVISDAFDQARQVFHDELKECLSHAYEGNPCDKEWNELQTAFEEARGDISNESAYQNYKAKQKTWNACHENFDAEQEEFFRNAAEKERLCQEQFQQKVDQAISVRQAEEEAANAKRQSDLAALDALEKRCAEEEQQRLISMANSADDFVQIHNQQVLGPPPVYEPQSAACTGITEATRTRTRQEEENLAKAVAIQVAQQLFDELGKTPIPTDAISDKIFAGIVATKLYARILELQGELNEAELSNDRNERIRLERQIRKYQQALSIWGGIAQGRKEVKEEITVFLGESSSCQTSGDCGEPVCCSATQIGKWACADGKCTTLQEACPQNTSCRGTPAQCLPNAVTTQAIFYNGKLIPLSKVQKITQPGCDAQFWCPIGDSALALDGTNVVDPAPNGCGYGKVGEVPVVEVLVQPTTTERKIEIRTGGSSGFRL